MFINTKKLTYVLSKVTLIVAVCLPVMAMGVWLFWDYFAPYAARNLPVAFNLSGLTVGQKMIGFLITLIGALIQAYGLLSLRTTFLEAHSGRPLSTKAIEGFQRFALVTLAMVLVGIVQRTGLIIIFSLSDPFQQGRLDIQFGSTELKALFMGLLLVFVAGVFAEGKRAKDENESFL